MRFPRVTGATLSAAPALNDAAVQNMFSSCSMSS